MDTETDLQSSTAEEVAVGLVEVVVAVGCPIVPKCRDNGVAWRGVAWRGVLCELSYAHARILLCGNGLT